ncbi:unnamed protein product [Urochloa humidicola]
MADQQTDSNLLYCMADQEPLDREIALGASKRSPSPLPPVPSPNYVCFVRACGGRNRARGVQALASLAGHQFFR